MVARLQRRLDTRAVRNVANEVVEVAVRRAHQPVDDGPALRIERGLRDRAFVDVGFAHRGEELRKRDVRTLPQHRDVIRHRLAGGDGSRSDRGVAEVLGDSFFQPERRLRIARLHEVVDELVQRRPIAAVPAVVVVDQHRTAIAQRNEHAAGVGVAPVQQHVEVRPALAMAGEEDDQCRRGRRRAECGVDLRQG